MWSINVHTTSRRWYVIILDYKGVRNAVWRTLIKHRVASLPVDVVSILNAEGAKVFTYEASDLRPPEEHDGFTIKLDGAYLVFFDDKIKPATRQRFTLAHELGHIVLGHVESGKATRGNDGTMHAREPKERAANIFASRLLAPACVLHELKLLDAQSIADTCGLSMQAAKIRADRMNDLKLRGAWYKHPLERKIKEQFSEYIATVRCPHKLCRITYKKSAAGLTPTAVIA